MKRFGSDLFVLISPIGSSAWFWTLLCSWAYTSQHADKEWRACVFLPRPLLLIFHHERLKALIIDATALARYHAWKDVTDKAVIPLLATGGALEKTLI